MKLLSIIAFILIAMIIPAAAQTALWADQGAWKIYGNSQTGICTAIVHYTNGRMLAVSFYKGSNSSGDKVDFAVGGLSGLEIGKSYDAIVFASTGAKGQMTAEALDNSSIIFSDINQATVKALVNSKTFYIGGLGAFEMTGSKNAMASAWQCYEALNSF